MDQATALRLITERDELDRGDRTDRLIQLAELLPDADRLGFTGQAAMWLFDDVKATWLYGFFASTVVTGYAFCSIQLAGLLRMLPDDPQLPDEAQSLEELAAVAFRAGAISLELRAALLELHDRHRAYSAAHLHTHERLLERHLIEAEDMTGENPLPLDARHALTTAIRLLLS